MIIHQGAQNRNIFMCHARAWEMCVLLLPLKNSVTLALPKSVFLPFQAQLCPVKQPGSPGVPQLGACQGIKNPKASGVQDLLA